MRAALFVALGATSVELIQAFISIKFAHLFTSIPGLEQSFGIAAIPILLGLGIYYTFFPPEPKINLGKPKKVGRDFLKGMLVSSLNVMAYPYWIFYGILMVSNEVLIPTNGWILIFCIGGFIGAFWAMSIYAKLASYATRQFDQFSRKINLFIGLIFLGLGVFQIVQVL